MTQVFFIIPTLLPSALFELDADISVFIYLFPFLRYKPKRECVAMQTQGVIIRQRENLNTK